MRQIALLGAAFRNYMKLECHPCIVGIWSVLDNTERQSQRGFIKLINGTYKGGCIYVAVVGENITAERNVRMEGNGGGKAVFQLVKSWRI